MFNALSEWIDKKNKHLFSLPIVVFILFMVAFPIVFVIVVSLTSWSFTNVSDFSFIGLNNYIDLLKNERLIAAVWRTICFTFITVTIETVAGVAIGLFLNRDFKGKNVVKTLFLLPMVATPVAISFVWKLIYEPTFGLANYVLKILKLPAQLWLSSEKTVLPSLMIIDIWQWTPLITLIILAGLAALPKEPYEAAEVDGANIWNIITKVSLPLIRPTIYIAVLIRMVDSLKTFDIIYALTGGGPGEASETINIYTYILSFTYLNIGQGSALVVLFFLLILIASIILLTLKRKGESD